MDVCCLDEMRKHLRSAPTPSAALQDSFVLTNPKIRSHGYVGDCAVLAVAIVQGWSYEATGRLMAPFLYGENRNYEIGVPGGDLTRVLGRFGFKPVRFISRSRFLSCGTQAFLRYRKLLGGLQWFVRKAVAVGRHRRLFMDGSMGII